ncbi:MAG: NAD-dependent epimerase/dehydratase family protein [Crocinitomicaceae bacterium]|nr:NAD-dependent epimerase/dehydratase family protein [Crocinitomicaceae bacterium]
MITPDIRTFIEQAHCVVTGGAGFIGSNLVEELLQLKARKVVVLDDLSTGFQENIKEFQELENFEFVAGSITDYEVCTKTFEGADIVFQMAALGSVPRSIDNPGKTNAVNVTGFLNVLNAARMCKVKKVVYSSSSSVYGDDEHLPKVEHLTGNPLSPYAVTKKANELYARVFSEIYGMDIVGLRYFNVFGPKQSVKGPYAAVIPIFIENLLNKRTCYINGDGNISRDFTYVQNVVEANICAAYARFDNPDDRVLNVAMGEQLSLNDLYAILEEEIQSGLSPIHREPRLGDIQSSQADISKAKKLIGYQPKYPLKEGLIKTIEWNRNAVLNS